MMPPVSQLLATTAAIDRLIQAIDVVVQDELPGNSGIPLTNPGVAARLRLAVLAWYQSLDA